MKYKLAVFSVGSPVGKREDLRSVLDWLNAQPAIDHTDGILFIHQRVDLVQLCIVNRILKDLLGADPNRVVFGFRLIDKIRNHPARDRHRRFVDNRQQGRRLVDPRRTCVVQQAEAEAHKDAERDQTLASHGDLHQVDTAAERVRVFCRWGRLSPVLEFVVADHVTVGCEATCRLAYRRTLPYFHPRISQCEPWRRSGVVTHRSGCRQLLECWQNRKSARTPSLWDASRIHIL